MADRTSQVRIFLTARDEDAIIANIRRLRPHLEILDGSSDRGRRTLDRPASATSRDVILWDPDVNPVFARPPGVHSIQLLRSFSPQDHVLAAGRVAVAFDDEDPDVVQLIKDVMGAVRRTTSASVLRADGRPDPHRIGPDALAWARQPGHRLRDGSISSRYYAVKPPPPRKTPDSR